MARITSAALGASKWRPRRSGQKGLRILSFDGGGTKGVLTISILKELMRMVDDGDPHEMFDMICGTSTGGIIANSTMSWWGAWLMDYQIQPIIYPTQWFGSYYDHYNMDDLCPLDWFGVGV